MEKVLRSAVFIGVISVVGIGVLVPFPFIAWGACKGELTPCTYSWWSYPLLGAYGAFAVAVLVKGFRVARQAATQEKVSYKALWILLPFILFLYWTV